MAVRLAAAILVIALAATTAACNKVQARTPPPEPRLDPPAAPVKVVIPSRLPEPVMLSVPSAATIDLSTPPPADPPVTRGARGASPPATPPATTAGDPQVLRTSTDAGEQEALTRRRLAAANRDLQAVQYKELGNDGKAQFEEVQRFIRSAEEALKVRNYVLARQLADKAALLAGLLVKGGLRPSGS